MAIETNEVRTIFVTDASQSFTEADALVAKWTSVEAEIAAKQAAIRARHPIIGGGAGGTAQSARVMQLQKELADREARYAANLLPSAKKQTQEVSEAVEDLGGQFSKLTAVAALAGGAVGAIFGAVVAVAPVALQRAAEYEKQMRVLGAAATENGVHFETARVANERFANQLGISRAAAAQLTGGILELASKAGKLNELNDVMTQFADLAAARNINPGQLAGLVESLGQGNTRAARRLGVVDINRQLREQARELKTTVAELTEYERATVAMNAIQEKAASAAGQHELQLNSLSGQVTQLRTALEEVGTSAAVAFSQSGAIGDGIAFLRGLVQEFIIDIDTVKKKLAEGGKPEDIAAEERSGWLSRISDIGTGLVSLPAASTMFGLDVALEGEQAAWDKLYATVLGVGDRREKDLVDAIRLEKQLGEAQQSQADQQRADEEKRKQALVDERNERQRLSDLSREYSRVIGNQKTTLTELRTLRENIDEGFDSDKVREFGRAIDEAIAANIERATERVNSFKEQAREVVSGIFAQEEASNPLAQAISAADQAMEGLRRSTKGLSEDLRESLFEMQRIQSSAAIFEARIQGRLEAADLRERAAELRSPTAVGETEQEWADRVGGRILDAAKKGIIDIRGQDLSRMSDKQLQGLFVDTFRPAIASAGARGVDPFVVAQGAFRLYQQREDQVMSMEDRFQKQLDIIDSIRPENEAERAAAERSIITLGERFDPSELNAQQRNRLADVLENQAKKIEDRELEKAKLDEKRTKAMEKVKEDVSALLKIAKAGGTSAVGLELTVNDETDQGLEVQKRPKTPSQSDVRSTYYDEAEGQI